MFPLLLGSVLVGEAPSSLKSPETREEFEQYVRQLDVVLEYQLEEIANLSFDDDLETLRRSLRAWRDFVDLDCEIEAREVSVDYAALRCVSEYLDRRYYEQEMRIVELEEARSRANVP